MDVINKRIYICGSGFPGYESEQDFIYVPPGEDFDAAIIDLIVRQLEGVSDSEIYDGVIAELFFTDGNKFKSYQICTDRKWDKSGEAGFKSDMEDFGEFLRNNISDSSARWSIINSSEDIG